MAPGWQRPLPEMPAPAPEQAWHRLQPPRGYEDQWRRIVDAALELGVGPDELAETGLEPLTAARGWKPATVALYTKVLRYGGLTLDAVRTPEPTPARLDLRPLTRVRSEQPEHLRATVPPSRRAAAEELAAAYRTLSYDSYRRLALAAGAEPVAARGVIRATRAQHAAARQGG